MSDPRIHDCVGPTADARLVPMLEEIARQLTFIARGVNTHLNPGGFFDEADGRRTAIMETCRFCGWSGDE